MTLTATINGTLNATDSSLRGLTTARIDHPLSFTFAVNDCTKVWSDRRTFSSIGYDDVDLLTNGISNVKVVCIKNLSKTSQIALSAGWGGSDFRVFRSDVTSWNFSPMINLGSLTLRGYPIREGGAFLLSCPNSAGFGTTTGGSILRIGGINGQSYEIYVLGV